MRNIILVLVPLLVLGCAQKSLENEVPKRISPSYEALGNAKNIKVYAYGNHTLIKSENRGALSAYDSSGKKIDLTFSHGFYRSKYLLNKFDLHVNGRTVYISRIAKDLPSVANEKDDSGLITLLSSLPKKPTKLELYSEKQIEILQAFIDKEALNKRTTGKELIAAQKHQAVLIKALESHNPIVMQHYEPGASLFNPDKEFWVALLEEAKKASEIHIRGRTDSIKAEGRDLSLSYYRAVKVRDHLVMHGVDSKIITINSLGEGDFAVPPRSKKARAINRRVEIEVRK